MCAAYFGLYLGHPQAYQYKNLAKEKCVNRNSILAHILGTEFKGGFYKLEDT